MAYINGKKILSPRVTIIGSGGSITVDQTYNPTSENAQSGKAVAEAIGNLEEKIVSDVLSALPVWEGGSY